MRSFDADHIHEDADLPGGDTLRSLIIITMVIVTAWAALGVTNLCG